MQLALCIDVFPLLPYLPLHLSLVNREATRDSVGGGIVSVGIIGVDSHGISPGR